MTSPTPCPTCSGPVRETVGMVCQTCGTDYGSQLGPIDAALWQACADELPATPARALAVLEEVIASVNHLTDEVMPVLLCEASDAGRAEWAHVASRLSSAWAELMVCRTVLVRDLGAAGPRAQDTDWRQVAGYL